MGIFDAITGGNSSGLTYQQRCEVYNAMKSRFSGTVKWKQFNMLLLEALQIADENKAIYQYKNINNIGFATVTLPKIRTLIKDADFIQAVKDEVARIKA